MRFRLTSLRLHFKRATPVIEFPQLSYFWGQMGAGKSSIARIIDFCLGAHMQPTPALQQEFVSATLELEIEGKEVSIFREVDNSKVIASWQSHEQRFELALPARDAAGVALPGTDVETLSDLIFFLAGIAAPKVRRNRFSDESALVRLSFRDLFWYCYLDQDEMDSDFFHLGADSHQNIRGKSIDALRFVLGFHQEQVASLEARLEETRERRLATLSGAGALKLILAESDISDVNQIEAREADTTVQLQLIAERARAARQVDSTPGHVSEDLKNRARALAANIQALEDGLQALEQQISSAERLRNELTMLSVRFRRSATAREVLAAVDFAACPRCGQFLPHRAPEHCTVCNQPEVDRAEDPSTEKVVEEDTSARRRELDEVLGRYSAQRTAMKRKLGEDLAARRHVDERLNIAMREYDSAFLSQALEFERQAATLEQQLVNLREKKLLPARLEQQYAEADQLGALEAQIRRQLKDERAKAERDLSNLRRLEELFLDCLLRAKFPGIREGSRVVIRAPDFMPTVHDPAAGDLVVMSFANLGSGGKKCVFKAAYALALHRLATEINAKLPSILIIDSPMKNISERENEDVFKSFYELVYQLAIEDLSDTQFILIDKEYKEPVLTRNTPVSVRHMMPNSEEYPPLIPYYRGL